MAIEKINSAVKKYEFTNEDALYNTVIADGYKYAVCYLTNEVRIIGCSEAELHVLPINQLLELRAFNEDGELRLVQCGTGWRGRIRIDSLPAEKSGNTEYLDELHLLWGDPSKTEVKKDTSGNSYSIMTEDRGTRLVLPFAVTGNKRVFLRVRNYLSTEQLEFVDYRLVEFEQKEAKQYGKK